MNHKAQWQHHWWIHTVTEVLSSSGIPPTSKLFFTHTCWDHHHPYLFGSLSLHLGTFSLLCKSFMTLISSALRCAAACSLLIYSCKQSPQFPTLSNEGWCKPVFSTASRNILLFSSGVVWGFFILFYFIFPPGSHSTFIPEISWLQLQMTKQRAAPVWCLWLHAYL